MKNIILVVCLIFSHQLLFAQMSVKTDNKYFNQLKNSLTTLPSTIQFTQQIQAFTQQAIVKDNFSLVRNDQKQMPSVYAFKDLAFFCKIEVHLEKAVKMPVKFRLGSVDYVDYLEGKRDSY